MKVEQEYCERVFNNFLKNNNGSFNYEKVLVKKYQKRVLAYLKEENPIPYEIEIQPSAKCNANCDHCWAKCFKRLEDNLEIKENADRVIDEILKFDDSNFSSPKIKFCGSTGEPLMNPLTPYFIERFYNKRKMRLFTNGIAIGERKFDREYLFSLSKLNEIYLSLDAGTTEVLWDIKRGAKEREIYLEDILEGVRKIKEINPKMQVNVSYVITKKNYKDILNAAEKAKKFGLDLIRYRIDLTENKIPKNILNSAWENLKIAKNFEENNFKVVPIHNEEEVKGKNKCKFGTKNLGLKCYMNSFWTCVGPNGKVYPCGHIVHPETQDYGNLLKESFDKIWNGEKRKNARENLPGKFCEICSPFSLKTNKLMSFLDSINKEKAIELIKNPN